MNETILAEGYNENTITALYRTGRISGEKMSSSAAAVLGAAQREQDLGKTWGETRDAARAVYKTLLSEGD